MNKIKRLYFFMMLSVMFSPTAIFANDSSRSMAETQYYDSNPVMIGEGSWETSSSRMNRQAAEAANIHSNPNQNRNEPAKEGSWETSTGRMNRQAAATANIRSNSNRIRDRQNRNESNAPTQVNIQR